MMRIKAANGKVLRLINASDAETVYYSKLYGFVSPRALTAREKMRRKTGGDSETRPPVFVVNTKRTADGLELKTSGACEVEKLSQMQWQLKTPMGGFSFEWITPAVTDGEAVALPVKPVPKKSDKTAVILSIMFALVISLFAIMSRFSQEKLAEENQKPEDLPPVVVAPIQKVAEPVVEPKPEPQHQAIDKTAKAQKALVQNLGFLKMVGKKDLKKAVGGLPTNVPEASAGAGAGGKEGSGGQLLMGLGEGLRKTTVGNSGVAGLGGVGTKGAGGGLGGYGDTDYGSGAGKSVSTTALSQDAVISGGLDRALIQATILRYLSQVRACYEEGLKKNADLIGQVTVNFEISGQGAVNYSRVQRSSLGDRDVESCITQRMMTWKFPTPKGNVNVKVSYPFMLRPVKS